MKFVLSKEEYEEFENKLNHPSPQRVEMLNEFFERLEKECPLGDYSLGKIEIEIPIDYSVEDTKQEERS